MKKTPTKKRIAWSEGDSPPHGSPVVATTHIEGITYQRKFVACGKERCRKGCATGTPSHGPYWYAVQWDPKTGKTRTLYVGKNEPRITEIADNLTGSRRLCK